MLTPKRRGSSNTGIMDAAALGSRPASIIRIAPHCARPKYRARRRTRYDGRNSNRAREKAEMETKLIKVAVADGVAVVTMDHPPVNAQNAAFNVEMAYV